MSLRWRDEVCIRFGCRSVALARYPRGWDRLPEDESVRVPVEAGTMSCKDAIELLQYELQRAACNPGNARVVVSDHWARYAVVPWSRDLADEAEQLAHGRLILRQIYGDDLAGWTLRLAQGGPGRARLVCALPTPLIDDLRRVVAAAQLRLVSLQPRVVDAYNRWRSRLPPEGAWFVSVDEGHLVAVRTAMHEWVEVHNLRVGLDWPAELARLRALERLATGDDRPAARVFVDAAPDERNLEAGVRQGWEWLDPPTVADRAVLRLGRLRRNAA